MPISRKIFSKKRSAKKSVRKNTRKHKKRTPRRKHRKSGNRVRFFGGFGEDGEDEVCAICLDLLTNGNPTFTTNCQHKFHLGCIQEACDRQRSNRQICTCPLCRTQLNPSPNPTPNPTPNPNPNPTPNPTVRLYRVQLFRSVLNPETGETDRVPLSINSISIRDMHTLKDYFIRRFLGSHYGNFIFYGDYHSDYAEPDPNAEPDPYGYIQVCGPNANNVEVIEGDMDINTYPRIDVGSVTITQVPNFNT